MPHLSRPPQTPSVQSEVLGAHLTSLVGKHYWRRERSHHHWLGIKSNDLQRASKHHPSTPSHQASPPCWHLVGLQVALIPSFLQKNHLGSISSLQHLTVLTMSGVRGTFLPPTNKSRKVFLPDTEAGNWRRGAEVRGSGWHKSEQNPKAWPSQASGLYSDSCWLGRGLYTRTPSLAFSSASQPTPSTGGKGEGRGEGEASGGTLHTLHVPVPAHPATRRAPLHCIFLAPAFEPPHGPPLAPSNESPRLCI